MTPIPEYHLELNPPDLHWFRNHQGTDRCFPAQLRIGADTFAGWIGYRGRLSRWFSKSPYDLWFEPGAGPEGQTCLHLNPAYRDPSLLRGRLALSLFAELGVTAPRAWHVWLTMGGRPLGLYTALESLNAGWLQRHQQTGSIYYAAGGKANFGLVNLDTKQPKRYLAMGYEKSHPDDDDFSELEELIYGITLPPDHEFEQQIDTVLDAEGCLRWLIGLEFTSHTDGVVQNYALLRPAGGRWQISPWDCDGTFGRTPFGQRLRANQVVVGTGEDNYLLVRLLHTARWRRRYLELWQEALAGPLAAKGVLAHLDAIYQEIRPYALADVSKRGVDSTFLREPAHIRRYVWERTAFVRHALADRASRWREHWSGADTRA